MLLDVMLKKVSGQFESCLVGVKYPFSQGHGM